MADTKINKPFEPEQFRIKFRAFFAVVIFIAVFLFLFVAILNSTAQAAKYTEFLLGFLTASLLAVIINFYYGSGDGMAPVNAPAEIATPPNPELKPEPSLPGDDKIASP